MRILTGGFVRNEAGEAEEKRQHQSPVIDLGNDDGPFP